MLLAIDTKIAANYKCRFLAIKLLPATNTNLILETKLKSSLEKSKSMLNSVKPVYSDQNNTDIEIFQIVARLWYI